MLLLCHDTHCRGHDLSAGASPQDHCRFCGLPLIDADGLLLVTMEGPRPSAPRVDLRAVAVCSLFGHEFEGVAVSPVELAGSCSRCGLRAYIAE